MNPERKHELDQAWLDALLQETFAADLVRDEARVAAVMQEIKSRGAVSGSALTMAGSLNSSESSYEQTSHQQRSDVRALTSERVRAPWNSFRNLSALAIAASLLVLAFFVASPSNQNQAYAAVARCVQSTPGVRQYRLQITSQRPVIGRRTTEAQLYFDASDRFVCEHPAWLGNGKLWIGGDSEQRWIAPPRGPVLVGGAELMGRWLARKEIDSPYLHLNSVLERMAKAYSLTKLDDEQIESLDRHGHYVQCVHVQGNLRAANSALPIRIDLWADSQSGIAQRLVVQWSQATRNGPRQWILDRVEPPRDLPNNWFEIEGHADGRPIRNARSSDDLDELP